MKNFKSNKDVVIIAVLLIIGIFIFLTVLGLCNNSNIRVTESEVNDLTERIEVLEEKCSFLYEESATLQTTLDELECYGYYEEPAQESKIENVSSDDIITTDSYDKEAQYIAKVVWAEARGCSKTEQAAVIWCILNRVDSDIRDMPDDIISVVTAPNQFAYRDSSPITDELYELAKDVISRWEREKNGETNVGRVLPKEYLWFHGDGTNNHFRDAFKGGNRWDWSLESPYN